jgi:uncharacterized delta-60 repeat protein
MSFGMQGTANSTQGSGLVSNVAIDAQQRVVATGKIANVGAYVSRLLDDGSLDPTFGTGGVIIGPGGVSGSYSKGEAILIEPDNKMVIAGMTDKIAPFVTRILDDGTTDTAFGSGGKTVITSLIEAIRLIKRRDGGYIMAGSAMECIVESSCDIVVVALDSNGKPDSGFGAGAIARIKGASNYSAWHGLAELPDGSIIVAGAIDDRLSEKLAVWQLRSDGSVNGGPFVLPGKGRATSAIVDMALHTSTAKTIDADAFERDTLAKLGAPKEVVMRHRLPQFNHLFSSDSYSAGYYSYLWSEVMDSDTREAFREVGDVFHKPTADKMRQYILAPGNSTDRTEAYRQFRGRDPDVKALLEKRGFPITN